MTSYEDVKNNIKGINKVVVDSWGSQIGRSILFYINNLGNESIRCCDSTFYIKNRDRLKNINPGNNDFTVIRNIEKSKRRLGTKEIEAKYHFPLLPVLNHKFNYKNITMYFSIIKESSEIHETPVVGQPQQVSLKYKLIVSSDEDHNNINEFILDAGKYFKEEIFEQINEIGKVKVKIFYDGYWEMLHNIPKRILDTIYLPDNSVKKFVDFFSRWQSIETEKWHSEMGIPYKLNVLLHGFPGTGKTSLIEAIASKYDYQLYMLNFNVKVDDTIFMRSLRTIDSKSILVLEDIDCLFEARKQNDEHKHMVTFSGLLNSLDGIAAKHGLVTFLTTNYKAKLDKALLRPGRIDYSLQFGYAT